MNERILALAEQAGYIGRGGNHTAYMNFDHETFAELIVRECVKSTLSLRDTAIDNQWNLDETFHVIVDTIAEDFDMQHIFRN
jgi:hypothetical protein